ncbi:hypothetical protein KBD20_00895 [Candidatus Saccharibacteria bacterium]|nr:hypothetical protein [Candidatus Saccharibacteria bacterium]
MSSIKSLVVSIGAVLFLILSAVIGVNVPVFADTTVTDTIPSGCKANSEGLLSAGRLGLPTYGCGSNTSIAETVLKLIFGAMAMIALLFIVIGGFKYTISGGDSNAIASAKKTITYAVLGLVLGISVFTIIGIVFSWLGR